MTGLVRLAAAAACAAPIMVWSSTKSHVLGSLHKRVVYPVGHLLRVVLQLWLVENVLALALRGLSLWALGCPWHASRAGTSSPATCCC
jgi:hypothetical protein